ncbi:hypothetical protein [Micromonospora sp. NPDC093277]|uniref:hypothetical protein n=1 Tax=Micromonospora sp. NPDC093277 TaxID=3364291 RepID=UPI0038261E0F
MLVSTLILTALTGCSHADERPCLLINAPKGIGVTINSAIAERIDTAELTLCWDSSCQPRPVGLRSGSKIAGDGCTGSGADAVCVARSEPTDEEVGFLDLPNLPSSPVEVTVIVTDLAGTRIVDQTLMLDSRTVDSPGECGGRPQGWITVDADGWARAAG